MTTLEPFKVRKGQIDKSIDTSIRIFGQPADFSHGYSSAELKWHFYDEVLTEYTLEIYFHNDSDTLQIKIQASKTKEDQTLCGPVIGKSTEKLLKQFTNEVKKPWKEWTEEEIMTSPMWVCQYKKDGNQPTQTMENMMAMASFQNPENHWVKKYFKLLTN